MDEIITSPRGSIGKHGGWSALRHFGTGALAGAAVKLLPLTDQLSSGDLSPLTDPGTLKATLIGAAFAGLFRGVQYFFTKQKEVVSPEKRDGGLQASV